MANSRVIRPIVARETPTPIPAFTPAGRSLFPGDVAEDAVCRAVPVEKVVGDEI